MSVNYTITEDSGKCKSSLSDSVDVPQVSSELAILAFMAEHQIPLQPMSIYGGLIHQQNITFSYRTVQNKVAELVDSADLKRVKVDTSDGVVRDIEQSDSGRAHYLVTPKGIQRAQEEVFE